MTELAKTFEPGPIEARWYAHWEGQGLFRPERPNAEPFTIVMPPPNVTGSLHIGHALDNTLQDILVRHARMQGKDSLWVVGTDHAGIATQMVVERNLDPQGIKRAEIGREAFLDHVWEWKAQSGGQITRQLRRLGASCDWANERFTMDEGFSKAVIKVFVELYKRKLLYRAKRLVNWDPKFQTAISDLEVENREVQGHMWHFKYPLAGGETYTYVEKDEDGNVVLRGRAGLYLDRHHPARDDARRRRGRGSPGRRALPADRRQALRDPGRAEGASAPDPDHHRRLSRPRISDRARSRSPARTTSTTMAWRSATASRCTG